MNANDKIEKIIKYIDKLKDGRKIGGINMYLSGYYAALKDVKEFIENICNDDEVVLKETSKIAKENPVEIKISEDKDSSDEFDIDKAIDEKLEEIGFYLVNDCDTYVHYEKRNDVYCCHTVMLIQRCGKSLIQSYDKDLKDSHGLGNTCLGLTYYETKLFMKKMEQKGWDK